jgi:hypothetical protein
MAAAITSETAMMMANQKAKFSNLRFQALALRLASLSILTPSIF